MLTAVLFAAFLVPQTTDSRFSSWLGCFRLTGDELRIPAGPELASDESEPTPARARARVCLVPEGGGVRVRTFADGEPFLEDLLVADGEKHPVDEGSCAGWQRTSWSADGNRLYTSSELTCEEGRERSINGISLFIGSTWIEIQSVGSDGAASVQVRRYRVADENETMELSGLGPDTLRRATESRFASSTTLSASDVVEAVQATGSAAVETALLETGSRFALDAETLEMLDDGGVPPQIIDLMVAVSFPERFVVDRADDRESEGRDYGYGSYGTPGYDDSTYGYGTGYGYGYGYDPYYRSAFAYPYFYAPFGYYYWYAPYHPVYGVRPVPSPGASVSRVIAGRGYTQVDRRFPSSGGGAGGGGRYAKPRDGSTGGSGSGGEDVSSGSSSSGSASPSGYTRSGSSGRSAKPKKKR